jgi:hypothetical protein
MPKEDAKEAVDEALPVYFAMISGRSVKVHRPTETQAALMGRAGIKANRAYLRNDLTGALEAVGDVLDVVEFLIVDESDREWLKGLMIQGQLEVQEVMEAVRVTAGANDPESSPKPRVTRGRAR